jgi:uncharacterized lipoprotein YajG
MEIKQLSRNDDMRNKQIAMRWAFSLAAFLLFAACAIPPTKPAACFCEPLKAVFGVCYFTSSF